MSCCYSEQHVEKRLLIATVAFVELFSATRTRTDKLHTRAPFNAPATPISMFSALVTTRAIATAKISSLDVRRARRAWRTPSKVARCAVAADDDVVAPPSMKSSAESTKMKILAIAAASARGEAATSSQKDQARGLLEALCSMNLIAEPAYDDLLNGDWELVYTETFPFRSSPFFWGVGKLLGSNSDFFYSAHDHQTSMFGGGCGRVVQTIDLKAKKITSDVIVKASVGLPLLGFSPLFSGFGSVITSGEANPLGGDSIAVPLSSLSTTVRQDDTSIFPALNFLNGSTVPVGDIMSRIANGSSDVLMTTKYLDENFRVSALEDGSMLVYRRA